MSTATFFAIVLTFAVQYNMLFCGVGVSFFSNTKNNFFRAFMLFVLTSISVTITGALCSIIHIKVLIPNNLEILLPLFLIIIGTSLSTFFELVAKKINIISASIFDKLPLASVVCSMLIVVYCIGGAYIENIAQFVIACLVASFGMGIINIILSPIQGKVVSYQYVAIDLIVIGILAMVFDKIYLLF